MGQNCSNIQWWRGRSTLSSLLRRPTLEKQGTLSTFWIFVERFCGKRQMLIDAFVFSAHYVRQLCVENNQLTSKKFKRWLAYSVDFDLSFFYFLIEIRFTFIDANLKLRLVSYKRKFPKPRTNTRKWISKYLETYSAAWLASLGPMTKWNYGNEFC